MATLVPAYAGRRAAPCARSGVRAWTSGKAFNETIIIRIIANNQRGEKQLMKKYCLFFRNG